MRPDACRAWRESLGAYVLGHLSPEEEAGIEAHLEGCPDCRAEAESMKPLVRLLPYADPDRLGPAPVPPPQLADRVAARIGAERRAQRRRRRFRIALPAAATAATAAAVLLVALFGGGGDGARERHVDFASVPPGVTIEAYLKPSPVGSQIHMYVRGIHSGALCRVFVRSPHGKRLSAGTFRYWRPPDGSEEETEAVLGAAVPVARIRAVILRVGGRTFVAPVGASA